MVTGAHWESKAPLVAGLRAAAWEKCGLDHPVQLAFQPWHFLQQFHNTLHFVERVGKAKTEANRAVTGQCADGLVRLRMRSESRRGWRRCVPRPAIWQRLAG